MYTSEFQAPWEWEIAARKELLKLENEKEKKENSPTPGGCRGSH